MSSEHKRKILAHNLQMQIEKTGLERVQICAMTGIKYNALCEWLMGHRYPRVDTIDTLAKFFGCRSSELTEEQTPAELKSTALLTVFQQLPAEDQEAVLSFARYRLQESMKVDLENLRENFVKSWKEKHPHPDDPQIDQAEMEVALSNYIETYKRRQK